jgi:membrane-associated progesterone receptor component
MPKSHPPTVLFKVYTPKTLEPFNGKDKDGRILLAIDGIVFDVTAGRNFYGPSECLFQFLCGNGES